MRYDAELLKGVEQRILPPTLRFFRFKSPTVSFGRLQKFDVVAALAPRGWDIVQRPTGGGIVLHDQDFCLSLCWPKGQAPLPAKPQVQYRWIHSVILEALGPSLRMQACGDCSPTPSPFEIRNCFTSPVGYDVMEGDDKVVGGALSCHKNAILYQGSIRPPHQSNIERKLEDAFASRFS